MPKVSHEYTEEKKKIIMDCALQLMQEIPLYQITMRDIIKKVGCSQGSIYRYYKGVDEIYVNLMNREIEDIDIKNEIDRCLRGGRDEKDTLKQAIELLGAYILKVQERVGGKFYFEILANYAFDQKKQIELLPTLVFKQNLEYIRSKIAKYVSDNIERGVFRLAIPFELFITYIGDTIDGISNHAAISGRDHVEEIMQLYSLLSDDILRILT